MVEVIAVFGPTGSGKTLVAETIADRCGTGSSPVTRCRCTAACDS